jgi:NADPH:quinone reductase-like Zn-dependent oxidoreductase
MARRGTVPAVRAVTFVDGRIEIATRSAGAPGADEVLVRVHGAGLNRADLLQRAGGYPAPAGSPADVPGLEFAGVVEAVGADVEQFAPGDRVCGIAGGGGQAEAIVVPAVQCTRVPDGLDLVAAGGVPEVFVTTHDAMVTQARLQAGEWVSVHAVGSGVGTAGLQLANALGARVVGTARTQAKLDRCAALGLDAGIVPGLGSDGRLDVDALARALLDVTGGVDVALDLVGGAYVEADVAAAAVGGRIVMVGALAGARATLSVVGAMAKRLRIHGTVLRARDVPEKGNAVAAFAADVIPLLARGTVSPVIDAVVPLERASEAYDLLASDATFGKVVLDCRA